jgi:hypothetical protein
MIDKVLERLFRDGGLLRVRGLLVLGLTAMGGGYVLAYQAMPPGEYNVLWVGAMAWYFRERANGR